MVSNSQDFRRLKVLSLGFTRELLVPENEEKGETLKRMTLYSNYLDKYFVLVFSLKEHQLKEKKIGNMTAIPTNGINRFDALFKMYSLGRKICKENEIDIIQVQDPIFTGFIGYLLKKEYKKPLNICVYGSNPYDKNWLREKKTNFFLAPLAKYLIKNTDGIQVDGQKAFQSLKAKFPFLRIFYKPMVPQDIKKFKEADGVVIKRELLKNREEKILLFVGRLVKQKNIPFLLTCFQKIIQDFSNVRLVIIGEGEEEEKLKDLTKELKIGNKVEWIKSVPYSRIPQYFKAADIFVLPSLYEGFARVLMEAAMAGKPIVSTNVGGTEDIIKDGENGFVINQGNEKNFVEKVLFLLQNTTIVQRMGEKGQELMEKKFSPQKTLLKQIEIWNKLAKK